MEKIHAYQISWKNTFFFVLNRGMPLQTAQNQIQSINGWEKEGCLELVEICR